MSGIFASEECPPLTDVAMMSARSSATVASEIAKLIRARRALRHTKTMSQEATDHQGVGGLC